MKCQRCGSRLYHTGHRVCLNCMYAMLDEAERDADEARAQELRHNIAEVQAHANAQADAKKQPILDRSARLVLVKTCMGCPYMSKPPGRQYGFWCTHDNKQPRQLDPVNILGIDERCPLKSVQSLIDQHEREKRREALPRHKPLTQAEIDRELFGE